MSDKRPFIPFPQSRVPGKNKTKPVNELGISQLGLTLDPQGHSLKGHWCSRCQGVWYGLGQEVACPRCGNRHG